MNYRKIKCFTATNQNCSDYFIAKTAISSRLYLFRAVPAKEYHWYLSERNDNFNHDLMAVRLQEVSNIEEAKKIVDGFWNVCQKLYSNNKEETI